jgi:hypothetical protein
MRTPQQQLVTDLLRALPKRPSAAQFEAVLDALVLSALAAKKPLMAIGATLRHCPEELDPAVRVRLRNEASARVAKPRQSVDVPEAVAANPREWLTAREAAVLWGCTLAVLYDRLRSPANRRRLGWPVWDGFRWFIAAAVFDPWRRAALLLAQPDEEPLPDLLPATCERAPRGTKIPLSIDDLPAEREEVSPEA